MLGLGGTASSTSQQEIAAPSSTEGPSLTGSEINRVQEITPDEATDFRVGFLPFKLRFAMFLADLGCVKESYEYCRDIKDFIASTEDGIK
jgi:hypothetical protein